MSDYIDISVIFLTLNEEFHLADAIDNVKGWAKKIFVLDSLSSDRTVDIALKKGATVIQRKFTNFGDQWNFAINNFPITTGWTLKLDPDERLTSELKQKIASIVSIKNSCTGYEFPRRLWFMGKPLHVKANVLRLWRTGSCQFSDVIVNEHPIINGDLGFIPAILEHYDSKSLHDWVEKQNRYSTMEAITMYKGSKLAADPKLFGTKLERRMFFKKFFFKVPFRYALQFIYELFIKKAILSGGTGVKWARLRVELRRMRELKLAEMRLTGRVPIMPRAKAGVFDERVKGSKLQKLIDNRYGPK